MNKTALGRYYKKGDHTKDLALPCFALKVGAAGFEPCFFILVEKDAAFC